jgi:hypothetical protein
MSISYDVSKHRQRLAVELANLRSACQVEFEDITPENVEQWRASIKTNLSGRAQTEALIIMRRISFAQHAIEAYLGAQDVN